MTLQIGLLNLLESKDKNSTKKYLSSIIEPWGNKTFILWVIRDLIREGNISPKYIGKVVLNWAYNGNSFNSWE